MQWFLPLKDASGDNIIEEPSEECARLLNSSN
jgi:hypothetical protein